MMSDGRLEDGHADDVIATAEMLARAVRDGERLKGREIRNRLLRGETVLGLVPDTGVPVLMIESGGDVDALNCSAGLQHLSVAPMVRDSLRKVMDPAPQAALSRKEAVGKVALWTAPTPAGRELRAAIQDELMELYAEAEGVELVSTLG